MPWVSLWIKFQKDGDTFCCIALSNPTEVVICDVSGHGQAAVEKVCLQIEKGFDSS